MTLLILFALLAGAGTALSPCVLPILPAVLSAGVTGGRRRPAGVVTGIVVAFTFATVALVYVIDALGPARRPGALDRDRHALRVRDRPARSSAGRPGRGVHQPHRPRARPLEGRGLLARLPAGNEPGPGLRALRRADPGRGHHGLGVAGLHRRQARGGVRLRDRLRRRPLCPHAGRAQAGGSDGRLAEPRPGRDGGPDGAHRGRDVRRARHPLPDDDRRRPAGVPRQSDRRPRGLRSGRRRSRRRAGRRRRPGRTQRPSRRWRKGSRSQSSGSPRSSRAPSSGSTRTASRSRSPRRSSRATSS